MILVERYAPTDTQSSCLEKHAFWTTLDRVEKEVLEHEQLFVLMNINARTGRGRRGGLGSEEYQALGACGGDTLNESGE